MADLYQPVTWQDGQQLTAVNSANRWENGLEALDNEVDAHDDRLLALEAGTVGSTAGQFASGPIASAGAPSIGRPYWATDLGTVGRQIVGTGSAWVYPDGTAITTTGGGTAPGTSTAPVLSSTVTDGGTIGAINLTWTPVTGASFYTVYETESPSGVSGATALTTTSSTRTPNTARNYEYWVTATVSGVESAASNHITAVLPYSASGGGGGGTGSNPSTFLNINSLGNSTGGQWNLGVGKTSGHVDIDPTALKTYVETPYYTMNGTGTAVQFQVPLAGGTTSANTHYPRCELREYINGAKAAWSGSSGHHIMRGATRIMHMGPVKPEVVVAQVHDASDDTLQIHVTGSSATGPQTWRIKVNGSTVATPLTSVALGTEVAWDIDVNNGALTVKLNGSTAYTGSPGWGSGQYFKCGAYAQQNTTDQANPSTEYSRVELRNLFVSHS